MSNSHYALATGCCTCAQQRDQTGPCLWTRAAARTQKVQWLLGLRVGRSYVYMLLTRYELMEIGLNNVLLPTFNLVFYTSTHFFYCSLMYLTFIEIT